MTKCDRPFALVPYGASELQDVRRRYMVRGVAASSLVWVAVFVLAGALLARFASISVPTATVDDGYYVYIPPEHEMVRVPPDPARAVPPAQARDGIVIPVSDEDAPPEQVIVPSDPRPSGAGQSGEPDDWGVTGGTRLDNPPPPAAEVLPRRGDPIDADELPVLVRDLRPIYPDLAREAGVEGRVIVHMLIGKDGRVMDAEIDANNSIVMLDPSVLEAVRKLVFTPAFRNGRPVPVWVARVYRFRLHGGTVE